MRKDTEFPSNGREGSGNLPCSFSTLANDTNSTEETACLRNKVLVKNK
jgi:hypothetical protein